MHLFRLLKILGVSVRYGLDEFFLGHERVAGLRAVKIVPCICSGC